MSMKAWLEGHQFDLDELVALLPSGDTRVLKEGDAYYLVSSEIDGRPADVPFYEVASQVLARISGLARVNNPSYRPVRLSGRYQEGDRRHAVITPDPIEVRICVYPPTVIGSSNRNPQPSPGPGRCRLAAADQDVAEALALMGQPGALSWIELWKVYEIIRDNVKPATVESLGWATPDARKAFTASANRPDVSGARARHARMSGGLPKQQMDESTARQFVSRLMGAWLDAAAGSASAE